MLICGLQKLSLLDYPENLSATIFTGGCNLRCPFCHNASLVLRPKDCEAIPANDVLSFLQKRVGKLDGVCITGGEPLLQPDLGDFISEIRRLGFKIKLDTNGAMPEALAALLERGLIDYVAMDIKNSAEKYPLTVGIPSYDTAPIFQSAAYLMSGSIPYEFRTTLVRQFHSVSDIGQIGEALRGAKHYYLQNFVNSGDLVGFSAKAEETPLSGFNPPEIEEFRHILLGFVENVGIRG
ncbi:MAG: anaerobic ribonucleoside-triphosphate reductase activating protein [Oscillospiraceae bacterium]